MQVADFPPAVAVITVCPAESAVTVPPETLATAGADELHVTVLSVAFDGLTVAVKVEVSPAVMSSVEAESVTLSTSITGSGT